MSGWRPNNMRPQDVDGLEDWELTVAACHFGPAMQDCVREDYDYRRGEDGKVLCGKVDVTADLTPRMDALVQYAGFDWREWCRERIREGLKRVAEERDDE